MDKKLNKEQIAHDLAVAYVTYVASSSDQPFDLESFVQEYVTARTAIIGAVERHC